MSFHKEFTQTLSGLCWSLWNELGVAGVDHYHSNCLVQVEELILFTAILSQHDPRLRDEAIDWCSRYHDYISISRLRALLAKLDEDSQQLFAQFAAAVNAVSSANFPKAADSVSLKVKLSGKSLLPPLDSPSLLSFRLRSLFGIGARADILTYLMIQEKTQVTAGDLVELGYSKRSLLTALDTLAACDLLTAIPIRNSKTYQLKKSKQLQVLVGKLPKIAPPWSKILQLVSSFRSVILEIEKSSNTT
ncbi:MAG: hypothetical protein KDK48_05880, partial [Chlamydiia bacterium]|nr:hypothetical protein [Chlamydiia bacterium]